MSGEYTYYGSGFFGFGEPGAFKAYGAMHLIPLLICTGLILLVCFKREWFRTWRHEETFRYFLSFSMFLMEFSYFIWLLYAGDTSGQYLMMSKLPLHLCDIGIISCMYMVISRNQTLFGFNFFVTLFGASLACIIPQTVLNDVNPCYFRYYQYFGEHLIPIFATVYMMIVHDMRPRYKDIWYSILGIGMMVIPALKLNEAFPGSDYLFLKLDTALFPENQYVRACIYALLLALIFHAMWILWVKLPSEKKFQTGRTLHNQK